MSILFLKNIAFYAYYVPKRYAATARYANRVRVCVNPPYADLLRNIRAALLSLIRYKVRYADHGPLLCAAAKPVQLLIQPLLLLLIQLYALSAASYPVSAENGENCAARSPWLIGLCRVDT